MSFLRFVRFALPFLSAVGAGRAQEGSTAPTDLDRAPHRLSYELTVGELPWRTSGPFTGITKSFRPNPIPYRMAVAALSVAQPVPLRSPVWRNFELVHSAVWSAITRGPEHHWGGVVTGLRFHYQLPARWHSAVFASWQGGVGAIDSSGQRYAQETDLTLTYLNALGVRTQLTRTVALRVQLLGQHISNGWQTHPSEGIDCAGFSLAVSYRPRR